MVVNNSPVIAAIGNFDGVHNGHQYLLDQTAAFAKSNGARTGVVLFDPHPRRYFRPDDPPFLLTQSAQRDALLRSHGAQEVYSLPFDKALASKSPEAFVYGVLKEELSLAGVVTGEDFRFGAARAGDGSALQSLGEAAGLHVKLVPVIASAPGEAKFGSSAIRNALQAGEVEAASRMLGRRWTVRGVVESGEKRGRLIGFPTANITLGDYIEPRYGVYAVMVAVEGKSHAGVANFGRRPTVGAPAPLLEAHLFDFDGDLYGKSIDVEFAAFIRDEQKFDGLEALKAQIQADCASARQLLM